MAVQCHTSIGRVLLTLAVVIVVLWTADGLGVNHREKTPGKPPRNTTGTAPGIPANNGDDSSDDSSEDSSGDSNEDISTEVDDSSGEDGEESDAYDQPPVRLVRATDSLNRLDGDGEELNLRPIIGILAQRPGRLMRRAVAGAGMNVSSYIAASYVKAVEGAGARVVPIMINESEDYYRKMAGSLNGILFPGGGTSITNRSGYGRAGDALYQLVIAANDNGNPTPLFAVCLGFEMLVYLASNRVNPLTRCRAQGRADPLVMQEDWLTTQLWRTAPPELMALLQVADLTSNFHKYCVTPESFNNLLVSDDYRLVSTSYDDYDDEYVSTIEHYEYPIFGTQWHAEKAPYEWRKHSVPHMVEAVRLNNHVMEVFVEAARRNMNQFDSNEEEDALLIYNYNPVYVSKIYSSSFLQCYFF